MNHQLSRWFSISVKETLMSSKKKRAKRKVEFMTVAEAEKIMAENRRRIEGGETFAAHRPAYKRSRARSGRYS